MNTHVHASINFDIGTKKESFKRDNIESLYVRSYLLILVFLSVISTEGQVLENIRLHVTNVNDFSTGYNPSRHTYEGDFIRDFIINPSSRAVLASVVKSIPLVRIRMESVEDGGHCPITELRLVPMRAAAFVYTLKGKHPLLNRVVEIKKIRKDIKAFHNTPGAKCIPLLPAGMKPLSYSDCEITFDVPIPASEVSNARAFYTVQFDVLDGNNHVIFSRPPVRVSITSYIPLIVSVGESLASGEGNPDILGKSKRDLNSTSQRDCDDDATVMIQQETKPEMVKKPYWLDSRDHRSLRSSHALAATDLLKDWPYVNFLSFAKSGSKIFAAEQENDVSDQLAHVRSILGDHKIDVLLISAGGNDVGFSEILKGMAKDFRDSDGDAMLSKFKERLPRLRDEGYPELDDRIKDLKLNIGAVLINEYSGHLFNKSNGLPSAGCGVFTSFNFWEVSSDDARAIDNMGNLLNEEVKRAADKFGWHFVTGISDKFLRHGYCSTVPYYKGATESCDTQGDFDGIMHPNRIGTQIFADAIARELRKVLPKPQVWTKGQFSH